MEILFLPVASAALTLFLVFAWRLWQNGETKEEFCQENSINYLVYRMSGWQRFFYAILAAGFFYGLAYIFYHSLLISVLVAPLGIFYPRLKCTELARRRQEHLGIQFREALYSLSSSVSAGKSLEAAFRDAAKDLHLLYPGLDAYIVKELTAITARLERNETLEEALRDLAERSGLEDIKNFAEVFSVGKRSGVDMVEVLINTSNVIGEKLRIKEEINTLLAQRRLEQRILNVMPVALVLLLTWSTGDYMQPMFQTAFGRTVMTAALALLAAAYYISKKISDIEV